MGKVSVDFKLCEASCVYVYVEKFCVSKLCDDKLCVNSCGHKRRREEEADGGIQNQKQEPHTKMWGKKRN